MKKERQKILIVKLSSLGDIVHAAASLKYLKSIKDDQVDIHWLVNEELIPLVKASGVAKRIIPFNRKIWKKTGNIFSSIKDFLGLIRLLKMEKYDIAIDLQCLFRSSIIPFLAKIPRRVGFERTREGAHFFLNDIALTNKKNVHAVEENLAAILHAFNIDEIPLPGDIKISFNIPEEKEKKVEELLKKRNIPRKQFILINPNSRWQSKKWGESNFKELIERLLHKTDLHIGVIGTKEERLGIEGLKIIDNKFHNFAGETDILELFSLIKKAQLIFTNDSGPMHLASASGIKTIAVFSATSPDRTGPYWSSSVIKSDVPCSPCFKKKCPLKGEDNMQCMRSITVNHVYDKIIVLLDKSEDREQRS
ncbi:MAG: lipopolysaccharide heptosyltransferase II [Candidatus Aureabacteria bacterium]|nr:lipopolysaccharide heptosyltransferase II [Candidatus Auribacterota bacterium]